MAYSFFLDIGSGKAAYHAGHRPGIDLLEELLQQLFFHYQYEYGRCFPAYTCSYSHVSP